MNRLDELLLLWQDQTLTPQELAELKQLLADPEGRARLAEDFLLTGVVLESLRADAAAREFQATAEPFPLPEHPSPSADSARPAAPAPRPLLRIWDVGRTVWLAGAAASLLVALGAFFWFRPPPATPVPSGAVAPASVPLPPVAFAQLEQVQGDIFVLNNQQRLPAQAGQVLVSGQGIATEGADSEAVVQMKNAVRLKLGGDTMVLTTAEASEPNDEGPRLVLQQGDLLVEATRSLKRKKMTVQTSLGVAVAETEEAALHVSDAAGVIVVRGEITFVHKGTGKSVRVLGGQYVVATAEGNLYAARFFAGLANVWTTFPRSGLETTSLGYGLVLSPDGKRLAAVDRQGERGVRLGPVDGQHPPQELRGERCVQFSADGKLLAAADQGNVRLYDVATGAQVNALTSKGRRSRILSLAFARDGKSLAVGRGGSKDTGVVEIWDVGTATLRNSWREHRADVTSVMFSPDGRLLASGSLDKTVVLRDVVAGQEPSQVVVDPPLAVWSLAFTPDSKTLAIATGPSDFRLRQPGEVLLWDVAGAKVRSRLNGHTRAVTSVVFSADGRTLISGSADTTVRFWDLATGREYGMLKGHKAAPGFEALAVALASDGSCLATVSFDRTVKVWQTSWIRNHPDPPALKSVQAGAAPGGDQLPREEAPRVRRQHGDPGGAGLRTETTMRSRAIGVLVCVTLSSPLHAEEWKGTIKSWDADNKRLIVSVAGKDREIDLLATTRLLDARGGEVPERVKAKAFQARPAAKITTTANGTKAEAQTIRLTNYYLDRPDEFYLDLAKAGPDLLIQGEYEGELPGHGKLGAQVAVKEEGLFSVVLLPGGLPGAGLDRKAKPVPAVAATALGKTTITGTWTGQIADGKLTGKTASGQSFTLTRVVRNSPTLGAKPPAGAVVLFDGTTTDSFPKARMSDDRLLKVPATSKQLFQDHHLHLEFLIPYRGPSGGNSGVYLQNCYEIQVFDSFGGQRSPSGCGGIYVFRAPDVNMSFPPLAWQTFDVDYTAARFDPAGKMAKNPVVTVRHNGVIIHDNVTLPEKGNGGRPTAQGGPLFLQAHGSPVRYWNIWVVERK